MTRKGEAKRQVPRKAERCFKGKEKRGYEEKAEGCVEGKVEGKAEGGVEGKVERKAEGGVEGEEERCCQMLPLYKRSGTYEYEADYTSHLGRSRDRCY